MNVTAILGIIQIAAQAGQLVRDLYKEVAPTLSSDDEAKIKAAIVDLQAKNDSDFASVMDKLNEAAKK